MTELFCQQTIQNECFKLAARIVIKVRLQSMYEINNGNQKEYRKQYKVEVKWGSIRVESIGSTKLTDQHNQSVYAQSVIFS